MLWQKLAHLPAGERVSELVGLLAVSERAVQAWTKDARAAEKEALRQVAAELAALGHLGPGGKPYGAGSVAAMLRAAA